MTGKCLCGQIEFTATLIPGRVFNCHCSRCRTSHGSDYATQAFAVRDSLVFKKGQDKLKEYESTGGVRTFCSECGSRLMNFAKEGGDYLSIAVACLDESYTEEAVAHCFTGSKAAWHTLNQEIPSFKLFPENF